MDPQDDTGGILNIALSDSDSDSNTNSPSSPTTKTTTTSTSANADRRQRRTDQSEADFQAVKASYVAKIENGAIHEHVVLPLPEGANKHHFQEILHAVEELYFFRRYQEAVDLAQRVWESEASSPASLDRDTRALLQKYETKCRKRLEPPS